MLEEGEPLKKGLIAVITAWLLLMLIGGQSAFADLEEGTFAEVYGTDGTGLRLRSGIWAATEGILPEGAVVEIMEEGADGQGAVWYEIRGDGFSGWVYGDYLRQASEESRRGGLSTRGGIRASSGIVDIALQYEGYRYVFGGTSPQRGFDSSGFLYYVFQTAGIDIPRDYWGMMNRGTRVSLNQLEPGDVVFFVNTYMAGLSHGAIYIGGGEIIHAVKEGVGVAIDSLWRDYYISRYYGARRFTQ